ncbi:MAG: hypothetical protein Fur0032_04670 [Terrimicrobiaceae bacterium]
MIEASRQPRPLLVKASLLVAVALVATELKAHAQAAELKALFSQALGEPEKKSGGPDPADQLEWAREKASAAAEAVKNLDAGALKARFVAVGLPADQLNGLQRNLESTARNYQSAADAIQAVIAATARAAQPVEISPPTSEKEADALRLEADALRQSAATMLSDAEIQRALVDSQRKQSAEANKQLDLRKEELAFATEAARPRAQLEVELASAEADAASSAVFAGAWLAYALELENTNNQSRLKAIEAVLTAGGFDSAFSIERAEASLQRLAKQKAEAESLLEKARSGANASLSASHQAAEAEPGSALSQITAETAQTWEKNVRSCQLWIAAIDATIEAWQVAREVAASPGDMARLDGARKRAERSLGDFQSWQDLLRRSLRETSMRVDALRSNPKPTEASVRKASEARLAAFETRETILRNLGSMLDSLSSLLSQIREETTLHLAEKSLAERTVLTLKDVTSRALAIWNKELFASERTVFAPDGTPVVRKRAVTLGRLTLTVILFLVGLYFSLRISKAASSHLQSRLAVEPARARVIQRAIFGVLAATVFLVSLNYVNIPLTAFAFLGGALAIGVGFGAQNLTNNFISGLILLAEQRIKVGDLIQVDGHSGRVKQLGTRCAYLECFDGVEVLIPNSSLLEKNVVNWTLSHSRRRFDFVVGVDYGASPDEVLRILRSIMAAETGILKDPAAAAFFENFGESTLDFRLYYWIDIRASDARQVGSNLRMAIDREFQKAGISIAYPQRDIHLSTNGPLRIQLDRKHADG